MDEPRRRGRRCRKARWTSTPRAPPCRPTGWPAAVASRARRGRLFPYGRHHGAPKLAIHTHANPGSPPGPRCTAKRRPRRCGHQRLSAVPRGRRPAASLAALSAGVATIIPTTQLLRNREVLRNYWRRRAPSRHLAAGVPTILAALAEVPLDGADISSLRYCRTARCRPNWPRA